MAEWLTVPTADGRDLEVVTSGPEDGLPLVYISGTPTGAAYVPDIAEAAAGLGWRYICYSRPGYAGSTTYEGRSVGDAAHDVATILDHLGHDRFVTLGWSGGGPHALACAALLPDRCAAAATLGGVAPLDAKGLDWFAGMGPENVEEFGIATRTPADLPRWLEKQAPNLVAVTGAQVADMLGGLVDDVDRAAITGESAEVLAEMFRRSVSTGIEGWRDDDNAFARHWGFELADITVPVSVWQGAHDLMVPFAHGKWLAAHIPGARVHLYDDEGHLSLMAQMPRIVADLRDLTAG